jgi:hypothetical protein
MSATTVPWVGLARPAKTFRVAHAGFAVANLGALAYLLACAATRRRDKFLVGSLSLLLAEGGALVVGGGNCPFARFQRNLGDPVPLFELVLPPKFARAAVPTLAAVTIAGMAAVIVRSPRARSAGTATASR